MNKRQREALADKFLALTDMCIVLRPNARDWYPDHPSGWDPGVIPCLAADLTADEIAMFKRVAVMVIADATEAGIDSGRYPEGLSDISGACEIGLEIAQRVREGDFA